MKTINNSLPVLSVKILKEPTLNSWFDVWISTYKQGRIKPTTRDTYISIYDRHLRYRIGNHLLSEFRPLHIQTFYNRFLEEGYSPTYLGTLHSILNSLFQTAVDNNLIRKNPCDVVERPSSELPERRVLSLQEQTTLCRYLRQPRFRRIEPVITTLLGTGIRIGELLGLSWSDIHIYSEDDPSPALPHEENYGIDHIDVRHTLVRVRNSDETGTIFHLQSPKTKKSIRSIPLQKKVVQALRRQKNIQEKYRASGSWTRHPEFDDLVFLGKKGQPQWRSTVVSNINTVVDTINREEIHAAAEENRSPVHMKKILPHAFRHTFATRCLEAGIPPKVVQHWLGHASIQMTLDLYTHVSTDLSAYHMFMLEAAMNSNVSIEP